MLPKRTIATAVLAALLPAIAHAQTQAGEVTNAQRLNQLFWSSLPIIIVAGFIFLLPRFAASGKRVNKYDDYREKHIQHMQRVEQTLDRILQALEKKP